MTVRSMAQAKSTAQFVDELSIQALVRKRFVWRPAVNLLQQLTELGQHDACRVGLNEDDRERKDSTNKLSMIPKKLVSGQAARYFLFRSGERRTGAQALYWMII